MNRRRLHRGSDDIQILREYKPKPLSIRLKRHLKTYILILVVFVVVLVFTLSSNKESYFYNNISDPSKTKKILVLGFHHSGTSIVAKTLMFLGIHGGTPEELVMLPWNNLKYNELKLAVDANKKIIADSRSHPDNALGRHGPWWLGYGYDEKYVSDAALKDYEKSVRHIIETRPDDQSWMIKDPRLCFLTDRFLELMVPDKSVCVIVWRQPVEVSLRMLSYNSDQAGKLSVKEYMELWEFYMKNAINSCVSRNIPIIYVPFEYTTKPEKLATYLARKLDVRKYLNKYAIERYLGVNSEKIETKNEVRKKLAHGYDSSIASLNAIHSSDTSVQSPLSLELLHILENEKYQMVTKSQTLSIPHDAYDAHVASVKGEGYATLISSDDIGYISGAIVLYFSVRRFDSYRPFFFLITEEVDIRVVQDMLKKFKIRPNTIRLVPKLPEPWFATDKYPECNEDKFTAGQKVRWGRMFSKLNVFDPQHTGLEKLIYLDTDTLVLRPLDNWFDMLDSESGDIFFGEHSPTHTGFNAGILAVIPSKETFNQLLEYGKVNKPLVFWPKNTVGCTEQELLNRFFGPRKLNLTRHADIVEERMGKQVVEEGARVAHWLTKKCPKPWDVAPFDLAFHVARKHIQAFNGRGIPKMCDPTVYKIWHHYYWSVVAAENIEDFEGNNKHRGISSYSLKEIIAGTKEVEARLKKIS